MKRRGIKEQGPKVPGYIVTYSDMVTLLLTFFVLLLSISEEQDPELVNKGRDSFIRSMRTFGLGMLIGRGKTTNFGQLGMKHPVEPPDEVFDGRVINAEAERTERIYRKLRQTMMASPSQMTAERTNFTVTEIQFSRGGAVLNKEGRQYLNRFCRDMHQDGSLSGMKLFVLGLARDAPDRKEQLLLSAKRAKAVADFLESALGGREGVSIYCWGAGSGGDWVGPEGSISEQSQIVIGQLLGGN
jgi:outer membrane protein OmpA-like peptidoglycan-associated protein